MRRLAAPLPVDLKCIHTLLLEKIQNIQLNAFNSRGGGAVESYSDVPHAVYRLGINCSYFAPNAAADNEIELNRLQFALIVHLLCATNKLIAPLVRMFQNAPTTGGERGNAEQSISVDVAVFGGLIELPSCPLDSSVPAVRMTLSQGTERIVPDFYISRAMSIFSAIMGDVPPSDSVKESLRKLLSVSPRVLQMAAAPTSTPSSSASASSEAQQEAAFHSAFPEPSPQLVQPDFFAVTRYYYRCLRCQTEGPPTAIDDPTNSDQLPDTEAATSSALKAALHSFRSSMKVSSSSESKQTGNSAARPKS